MNALDGKLVVLVGGSGFVGSRIAQELLERGARVRIAGRDRVHAFKLKPLANLGQVQFAPCDVRKPASIAAAMQGADAAVYLVGTFSGEVEALQRDGAGLAAQAAKDAGAQAFVYVSAIGANAESDSRYARSKAEGEQAVFAAFPQASVLRPSVLFGQDDNFINLFAKLIAAFPVLPVFGPEAKLQPLFVDDAARAVVEALADSAAHGGRIFEIAGPEVLTMGRINRMIAEAQGRKRAFAELPDWFSRTFAAATGWLPGAPLSLEQWTLLEAGSVPSGAFPGLKALGITPRPLELFLDRWMLRYRAHGRFGTKASA